jgi:hypothetical protein
MYKLIKKMNDECNELNQRLHNLSHFKETLSTIKKEKPTLLPHIALDMKQLNTACVRLNLITKTRFQRFKVALPFTQAYRLKKTCLQKLKQVGIHLDALESFIVAEEFYPKKGLPGIEKPLIKNERYKKLFAGISNCAAVSPSKTANGGEQRLRR